MKGLLLICALLLTGCGSDGNVAAVTPVLASTRGTYLLSIATADIAAADGSHEKVVDSGGTLRLFDTTYQLSVTDGAQYSSDGTYTLGSSVNTILNSRHGSFSLTSSDSPFLFTGQYQADSDFSLTLNYDRFALPDQSLVTRSETWLKISDSPQHGT